ncbi:unnamed protein product [Caenorhabditis bovis]|uniref:Piwi domain-containing protein n=1 Tax=Caenorhabditis bovis TaxID=2654633 RepID=A0A8S1EDH7_9PELO|nr:unnamed protein product [Caenorhabditis bovis]
MMKIRTVLVNLHVTIPMMNFALPANLVNMADNHKATMQIKEWKLRRRPEKMIQDTELGKKTIVQTNYIRVHPSFEPIVLNVYKVVVVRFEKNETKTLTITNEIASMFWKCVEQNANVFPPYENMIFNDKDLLWSKTQIQEKDYETQCNIYDEKYMKIGAVTLSFVGIANYSSDWQMQDEEHEMAQLIDLIVTARNRCHLTKDSSYFYNQDKNTYLIDGNHTANIFSIPMVFYVGGGVEASRGMHFSAKPNLRGGTLANVDRRQLKLTYENHPFTFGELTDSPANRTFITVGDNRRISVAELFESDGNPVKYPNLPCIFPASSNNDNKLAYPIEYVTTSARIAKFKEPLTDRQEACFTQNSMLPPHMRLALLEEMIDPEHAYEKTKEKETKSSKKQQIVMEMKKKILAQIEMTNESAVNDESRAEQPSTDNEGPSTAIVKSSSNCWESISEAERRDNLDTSRSVEGPSTLSERSSTIIKQHSPDFEGPSTSAIRYLQDSDGPSTSTALPYPDTDNYDEIDMDIDEDEPTDICLSRPAELSDQSRESFPRFIDNKDQWMTNFSTAIEKKFLTVRATILPVPTLIFGNSSFYDDCNRGGWGTGLEQSVRKIKVVATQEEKTKMLVPGILVFHDPNSTTHIVDDQDINRAPAKLLLNTINEYGQPVYYKNGEPQFICATQKISELEQFLKEFREKAVEITTENEVGVPFLLCIFTYHGKTYKSPRDKFAPDYAILKSLCDCEIGIYNQRIFYEKYEKLANEFQKRALNNLALIILAKIGAVPFILERGGSHENWAKLTDPTSPTMVVGIGMSHPSAVECRNPQSLDSLSVATIVSNIDVEISQFRDTSRVQLSGERTIADMTKEFKIRINEFVKHSIVLMSHIVIYREGVSENQFSEVLEKEKPGTLVEDVITSSKYFDFFLISQMGTLETSKPVHYYVLYDDWKPSHSFWQTITHALSYNFISCTNAISLPAPLMYANIAAEKARCRSLGGRIINQRDNVNSFNITWSTSKTDKHDSIDGMIFL